VATLGAPPLTQPPEVGERPTGALVYDVDGVLRVHPLRRDLICLGRGHRADISFGDDTVSRRHALVLTRPDGAVEVIEGGVHLNGSFGLDDHGRLGG
jgi:pSer/pThr/pTyr-binding forkhead associated (FHA) protein